MPHFPKKRCSMGKKNKIAVLICYYGRLPWYFNYFLHSCGFNTGVDFFIFSDATTGPLPPNARMIALPFADLKELVCRKTGLPVQLDTPYKLCDFKPAYGLIFSEYISGYDFWAHGDIDVIFGDIENFLTPELLDSYDFISLRHDYTTGCFAAYRNNARLRTLFMCSRDYQKVFTSSRHFCFDECNFVHDALEQGRSIFELNSDIESFTHVVMRANASGYIRAHFDVLLIEGTPGRIRFDHGMIIYRNKYEAILYHLVRFKKAYHPAAVPDHIPDRYCISPTRIYPYRKQQTGIPFIQS